MAPSVATWSGWAYALAPALMQKSAVSSSESQLYDWHVLEVSLQICGPMSGVPGWSGRMEWDRMGWNGRLDGTGGCEDSENPFQLPILALLIITISMIGPPPSLLFLV